MTDPRVDNGFESWAAEGFTIDERGKLVGAKPGEPNNWGRWGPDDQQGTLNLLTAERVAAAASLVRTGRRFSLGTAIGAPTPTYRPEPLHLFRYTTSDALVRDPGMFPGMQISDDYLFMALHGSSHIDALCHVASENALFNGFWAGATSSGSGARRLGVHQYSQGLVGRGVLLDIARFLDVEYLAMGDGADASLLQNVAAAQGVEVLPGDLLLVRTGFLGWWKQTGEPTLNNLLSGGLSARALPWLAERDIAMIGADNLAVEGVALPDEPPLTFHIGALRNLGLPLCELLALDELAEDCATDGIYEFLFVAAPLTVVNGAGSPLNPIAIK
jgi:kynurenine formamidase